MYNHHSYNDLIESKLSQLPQADASELWGGMQAILDKNMPEEKRKQRYFLWLFNRKGLVLMSTFMISALTVLALVYSWSNSSSSQTIISGSQSEKETAKSNTIQASNNTSVDANLISQGTEANKAQPQSFIEKAPTTKNNNSTGDALLSQNNQEQTRNIASVSEVNDKKQSNAQIGYQTKTSNNSVINNGSGNRIVGQTFLTRNAQEKNNSTISFKNSKTSEITRATESPDYVNQTQSATASTGFVRMQPALLDVLTGATTNYQGMIMPTNLKEESILQAEVEAAKAPYKLTENEKGWYAGVIVGMDLSSIHFNAPKTGTNKGLLFGYAVNERWSIETGMYWDQKRFYGAGTYFRPSNYTLPPGVTMLAVTGDSKLYEWPVNIRYSIIPNRNKLFVTAGLSSYFMRRENYEYEYEQNGQYGKNYASYTNQSNNMLAVVNMSLGYSHKLGSLGSVRMEPYVKIPLKDLGVNNMPVMSTGINIGFTRRISK
jgi:hypothetical protein